MSNNQYQEKQIASYSPDQIHTLWKRYGEAIVGKLEADHAANILDETLDRILSGCVGSYILPLAIRAREIGLLTAPRLYRVEAYGKDFLRPRGFQVISNVDGKVMDRFPFDYTDQNSVRSALAQANLSAGIKDKVVIKGCPRDKWDEVQAIQNLPFVYIMSNGSKWAGQEEDDIEVLLEVLEQYSLDERFGKCAHDYWTDDPCEGVRNPDWSYENPTSEQWINGDRLYVCDGVVRFFGNFLCISHGFSIDTNHKPTIDRLKTLIQENVRKRDQKSKFAGDTLQEEREANLFKSPGRSSRY